MKEAVEYRKKSFEVWAYLLFIMNEFREATSPIYRG